MTAVAALGRNRWLRCHACRALVYRRRMRRNLEVCPECGDHQRLTAAERIGQLVDPDSFTRLADRAAEVDPLGFVDSMPYRRRLAEARAATGMAEAVLCGTARIGGHRAVLAVMDFRFLGGSLGCATGELITRAAEEALAARDPLVLVTASGGARMQEGVLALMQMATVSCAIAELRAAGLLTVSVVTDPTYGGVAASFATNTDLVIAERGARMGFAGPRVIRETIRQALPPGFQTAEFLLRHGQVDMVVERHDLRPRLRALLALAAGGRAGAGPLAEPTVPGSGPIPRPRPTHRADATPTAWQSVRTARDLARPTTLDYLRTAFDGFVELHGDRLGADCPAIVAGLARLGDQPVAVIGQQKGHDPREMLARNFGMASPAGYRKALRVMGLAARLGLPVVTLIDTPGAHPGVDAEEQGQAAAIATCLRTLARLPTPVVAVVTGEGGSGGALALAVADRVLMLQNAVYSVISPEGCAAILFHDRAAAPRAAAALQLTAPDLVRLGVADGIVGEPPGGAQRDPAGAADRVRAALTAALSDLLAVPTTDLLRRRSRRFRRYGAGTVDAAVPQPDTDRTIQVMPR
ncbi:MULTISPECIES: acetyl-CoA carboxylase carboxyltransferase subunit alpha [unclassified Solwaraspora]|uniref:acetyl-CoA carboxylase carboxyltransferase subunit alpha n=1 Tax=unclassified Solwaraspora TaxID=2627926 RepID=UPI00248BB52E|nr:MULTISPECIES: acetyl-CoA carboxylase carboxyltransferase subunit alpha [unclassified Solwaraspora]WBB95949.1 acetyl-CoA carboxylase carboxyltransferase subunit alpha [Solwaraspora sp. WMMA2059]WBC20146.1 acetyl-CoA carboxylase carboxyltransferase subunit alpha [Solwaraspora sp. WMMA2080]WJK32267.1 acetyl-CoA carboxylase carboxyltransferase subunit alpha [Solwaraspora sp. WMMA2065]